MVGKFAFLNLKNNKIQDEYKLPNYKKIQREFDGTQVWQWFYIGDQYLRMSMFFFNDDRLDRFLSSQGFLSLGLKFSFNLT